MAQIHFLLCGEIDASTAPRLQIDLAAAAGDGADLLVDCRQLTFIDCAGVRALREAGNEIAANGHRLMVSGLVGMPRRVFELLELTEMFEREPAPAH